MAVGLAAGALAGGLAVGAAGLGAGLAVPGFTAVCAPDGGGDAANAKTTARTIATRVATARNMSMRRYQALRNRKALGQVPCET